MKLSKLLFALLLLTILPPIISNEFVTVNANPFPTYPIIKIESPTNTTYVSSTILLNVTLITKWDGVFFTSDERVVTYSIDSQAAVPITQTDYRFDPQQNASILYGTETLTNLTSGIHNLLVNARYEYDNGKHVYTSKADISFTINTDQTPSSSPSVSEFSCLTILPILLTIPIALAIVRKRLQRNV